MYAPFRGAHNGSVDGLPSFPRRTSTSNPLPRWVRKACAVSLSLHIGALGALAAWSNTQWATPPRLGATQGVIVLQASHSEPAPALNAVNITVPRDDVVILPHEATVANRRFVDTPSARVPLEKFLTRDVLDRLLDGENSDVTPSDLMQKETLAQANATPSEAIEQLASRPPSPRRPITPVKAVVQASEKSAQADAGLRTGPNFAGNRPPNYPPLAQRNGWEGRVLLRLYISAAGTVTKVEVVRSSGYDILDAEAVATLRTWRGAPATLNGRPVETVELQSVRFGPRR